MKYRNEEVPFTLSIYDYHRDILHYYCHYIIIIYKYDNNSLSYIDKNSSIRINKNCFFIDRTVDQTNIDTTKTVA